MANYNSSYTGSQIDNAVGKVVANAGTAGQVLTADGSGGSSWQTPSEGSQVSGTNDGTNWTSITIDGNTKNIPQGGSGGGGSLYLGMAYITCSGFAEFGCNYISTQPIAENISNYNTIKTLIGDKKLFLVGTVSVPYENYWAQYLYVQNNVIKLKTGSPSTNTVESNINVDDCFLGKTTQIV